tara:strand:- start:23556 stop:24116 length:561 start_codon:yes stop_codon:yes gene_type:complete
MSEQIDFQLLSFTIKRLGWIRFWVQLVLGVVVIAVLVFTRIGSSLGNDTQKALGLAPGLSLTTLAFFLLLYSLWQGWLIVRAGRAVGSKARPSRGQTSRLIKRGLVVDLIGMIFSLIGYQALMGPLFIQASMQTPGISIGSSARAMQNYPITSLEILSVLSNTQVLTGHFIGLCMSLWLLRRIYKN